jgi:hypothetical protein
MEPAAKPNSEASSLASLEFATKKGPDFFKLIIYLYPLVLIALVAATLAVFVVTA